MESQVSSVLMAHALRRISFSTCDPANLQFSFLAREPNGQNNQQYCHSFLAPSPDEAEELNRVVGAAFRMAYAQQLAQPLPMTASVATPPPPEVFLHRNVRSRSPILFGSTCRGDAHTPARPPVRTCWAKRITKTKHQDPLVEQAIEMSIQPISSIPSTSSSSPAENRLSARSRIRQNVCCSATPNGDLWPPHDGGSSSSEESNSPTDLNSCKQMKDKPPLLKNLEVIRECAAVDPNYVKDICRPPSGGYINEGVSWENSPNIRATSVHEGLHRKKNKHVFGKLPVIHPNDGTDLQKLPTGSISKRASYSSYDQANLSNTPMNSDMHNCKRKSCASTASSSIPPPPPERYDSLTVSISEERELRVAPWFQAGIPREIALEILSQEPIGSFMVRESTSKPGCFALSLRVPHAFHESGIAHYLIMRTGRGYRIKGFTKEFGTLTALITHHSVMPELLPCTLSLSKHNPTFKKNDSEDLVDIDEDPDYNLLSDFRKMLADINA